MTEGQHISQDDLALYALQALSKEESASVRLHVATCEACRDELARLQGDLALVAFGVDRQPIPDGARQRFVDRLADAKLTGSAERAAPPSKPIRIDQGRKSRFVPWVGWIAAAALLLVALSLGFEVNQLKTRLGEMDSRIASLQATNSRALEVVDVLTAPAAQRVLLTKTMTPAAPVGRVVYLPWRGALIFQASNLAPVPAGKAYELWVIPANGSAPIPAGLFQPDAAGDGSVVLPSIPAGIAAKGFGVTVENAAGSPWPTAPILLSGAVSQHGE